jgi:hypothetical protein
MDKGGALNRIHAWRQRRNLSELAFEVLAAHFIALHRQQTLSFVATQAVHRPKRRDRC